MVSKKVNKVEWKINKKSKKRKEREREEKEERKRRENGRKKFLFLFEIYLLFRRKFFLLPISS